MTQPVYLAVNVMVWVGLVALAAVVFFVTMFLGTRWLGDVSRARRYGWKPAGEVYATSTVPESGWVPIRKMYWSSSVGGRSTLTTRAEMWFYYYNCRAHLSESGLTLRWGGKARPFSEPKEHPVLHFPWIAINPGRAVTEKGRGRRGNVVVVDLVGVPGVGFCLFAADANQIAQASGGRWSITPPSL